MEGTDAWALRRWLRQTSSRLVFPQDFLEANKHLRPASDLEVHEFSAHGMDPEIELAAETLKGRGRSRDRMKRLVVAWLLSEGWRPYDAFLVRAQAEVELWFLLEGRDLDARAARLIAEDIAECRRRLAGFPNPHVGPIPCSGYFEDTFFDAVDDEGMKWRVWTGENYRPHAVMLREEPLPNETADSAALSPSEELEWFVLLRDLDPEQEIQHYSNAMVLLKRRFDAQRNQLRNALNEFHYLGHLIDDESAAAKVGAIRARIRGIELAIAHTHFLTARLHDVHSGSH